MPFYLIFILLFFWVVADDVAFTFSGIGRPTSNCMCIKMKPWTERVYVCVGAGERATRQSRQQSWKCDCDRVTHSYEYKLFIWCSFWLDIFGVVLGLLLGTTTRRNHIDPTVGTQRHNNKNTQSMRINWIYFSGFFYWRRMCACMWLCNRRLVQMELDVLNRADFGIVRIRDEWWMMNEIVQYVLQSRVHKCHYWRFRRCKAFRGYTQCTASTSIFILHAYFK